MTDTFDPSKALNRRRRKKKRSAFLNCLIAALLMTLLAAAGTIIHYMSSTEAFENALLKNVDYTALGTDEASVRSFARETIHYLSGAQSGWNPQIAVGGFPASQFIPQSFREHMALVRQWVITGKSAMLAVGVIVLIVLARILFSGVSLGGYYLGMALPLAAIGGLGGWAYVDFDGMWSWLHRVFIPDGIFSAAEPIMQLFPLEMFNDYLAPCGMTFGLMLAVILLLPLALAPLAKVVLLRRTGQR